MDAFSVTALAAILGTYLHKLGQDRIAERRQRAVARGWHDCIVIENKGPRLGDLLAQMALETGYGVKTDSSMRPRPVR